METATKTSAPVAKRALSAWDNATKPLYWLYERRLLSRVQSASENLPHHIGIIMDGNRRFAKTVGLDIKSGHDYGAGKAREVLDWCLEIDIQHVTLWGFSTENKGRKAEEVAHLHSLFEQQAKDLLSDPRLHDNKVRVKVIGDIADFPEETKDALRKMEEATQDYDGMHLNIALGYGGREEIISAVQRLLHDNSSDASMSREDLINSIDAEGIRRNLYTAGIPDPDFVIRTSGEVRLSGFLLWQTAYSEFYFCDAFWPSFRKMDFLRAIRHFQQRERRFGK